VYWLLGPDADEDAVVQDEHYADEYAEAIRLHNNGGYKVCMNNREPAEACVFCNTHLGDPFAVWKMKLKLTQNQDSETGKNELSSDLMARIRARARDFRPTMETPTVDDPITRMP